MTITGSDGKPVQIPQALVAAAQLGQLKPGPDGTVTVQGADGNPMKIPAATLAATAAAAHAGRQTFENIKFHYPMTKNCYQYRILMVQETKVSIFQVKIQSYHYSSVLNNRTGS